MNGRRIKKNAGLFSIEAKIKRSLRNHLKSLGFIRDGQGRLCPPDISKDCFRDLHKKQRKEKIDHHKAHIQAWWPSLKKYFANGNDLVPDKISARLELVESDTWQSDLFRLASLTWSVPVSQGYGRRMRFLVWDDSSSKLIGIFALGDPVFNLAVRDDWIGWNSDQRKEKLVNIMDAYVLGAVPPYNSLLGGKLIASLICSKEVLEAFRSRYKKSKGIISNRYKKADLCLVTTTSALGRSSIYNRLSLNGQRIFSSIGYTSGWGHFHIPDDLFSMMREYLAFLKDQYADNHKFGDGPNWRLRVIRKALRNIGLNPDILRHGISREVFVCPLARNAVGILIGKHKRPNFSILKSTSEISQSAIHRWILPRSERRKEFRLWKKDAIMDLIHNDHTSVYQHAAMSVIRG